MKDYRISMREEESGRASKEGQRKGGEHPHEGRGSKEGQRKGGEHSHGGRPSEENE